MRTYTMTQKKNYIACNMGVYTSDILHKSSLIRFSTLYSIRVLLVCLLYDEMLSIERSKVPKNSA